MNFVKHLRDWVERFEYDDRLSTAHIALYFVLFHEWNRRRFVSPFPVFRSEMMGMAKIRSPNAYARCMRELDQWGYTRYLPSHNPRQPSEVHLFPFNKGRPDRGNERRSIPTSACSGSNLYENTTLHTGIDKEPGKTASTDAIPDGIPFNVNEVNKRTNKKNLRENKYESDTKNFDFSIGRRTPDRATSDHPHPDHQKQKGNEGGRRGTPGDVEEVKTFFASEKVSPAEAEQFYNYFQSVGWKVGMPQKPVEDWRFAAKFWINNIDKTKNKNDNNDESLTLRPGASNVRVDKSYDQPL
jgi:hypothetical protein